MTRPAKSSSHTSHCVKFTLLCQIRVFILEFTDQFSYANRVF